MLLTAARALSPLVILAAGLAAFSVLGHKEKLPTRPDDGASIPVVTTVVAQPHQEGLEIEIDGLVEPRREIMLSAEVAGRITAKSEDCRAGKYVKQGALLLEIDPATYELEVQRLTFEVEQARANLHELDVELGNSEEVVTLAKEQLQLEQNQLVRSQQLRSSKALSADEFEQAQQDELTTRNNLTTLENQHRLLQARRGRLQSALGLAETQLRRAELDLEYTKVRSPAAGVVINDLVEQDCFVQRGTQLVSIEDSSAVEVRCSLRMDELHWLWLSTPESGNGDDVAADYMIPETPVTVLYRLGGQELCWEGVLQRFDGYGLDAQTRTVPCRVLVRQPRSATSTGTSVRGGGPRRLMRGMYVKVRFRLTPPAPLVRLPARSLRPGSVAWRVRDGKLQRVPVNVARHYDEMVLVNSDPAGIAVGDHVVVSPLSTPVDGVRVQEEMAP